MIHQKISSNSQSQPNPDMKLNKKPATFKLASIAGVALMATFASSSLQAQSGGSRGNSGNSGNSGNQQRVPAVPVGWLSANPEIVKEGTKPNLSWAITHPSRDNDIIVSPPGTLVIEENLQVEITVIGTGVTTGGCDGDNTNWVPAEARVSVNGGGFTPVFYGTNPELDPSRVVWYDKKVNKGTTFDFAARYYFNDSWSTLYSSKSGCQNVRVLKKGDFPPTAYPLHTSSSLKPFMTTYLDADGRIEIGHLDAIVMIELTQPASNSNSPCYNLQDMVLLVSCTPKSNNGHGNNYDGVDSSNPGKSKPVDPSGDIDDEMR